MTTIIIHQIVYFFLYKMLLLQLVVSLLNITTSNVNVHIHKLGNLTA